MYNNITANNIYPAGSNLGFEEFKVTVYIWPKIVKTAVTHLLIDQYNFQILLL
jgi:hypothetical protein